MVTCPRISFQCLKLFWHLKTWAASGNSEVAHNLPAEKNDKFWTKYKTAVALWRHWRMTIAGRNWGVNTWKERITWNKWKWDFIASRLELQETLGEFHRLKGNDAKWKLGSLEEWRGPEMENDDKYIYFPQFL